MRFRGSSLDRSQAAQTFQLLCIIVRVIHQRHPICDSDLIGKVGVMCQASRRHVRVLLLPTTPGELPTSNPMSEAYITTEVMVLNSLDETGIGYLENRRESHIQY